MKVLLAGLGRRGIGAVGHSAPLVSPAASLRLSSPPLPRCAERPTAPIGNRGGHSTKVLPRWLPRASGDRRSEVKEESRAKPGSGDMSGAGHPMSSACADLPMHPRGSNRTRRSIRDE